MSSMMARLNVEHQIDHIAHRSVGRMGARSASHLRHRDVGRMGARSASARDWSLDRESFPEE